MFWHRELKEDTDIRRVITDLEYEMTTKDGDSEEYANMLNRLERLYKLYEKNSRKHLSPDTKLLVAGNLVGILIIVAYEHGHVITSKAVNQIGKLR